MEPSSSASPLQPNSPGRSRAYKSSNGKSNHCSLHDSKVKSPSPSAPRAPLMQLNSPARLGANKSSSSVESNLSSQRVISRANSSSSASPMQRNSPGRSSGKSNHRSKQRNSLVELRASASHSALRAPLSQRNSFVRSGASKSSESNLCSQQPNSTPANSLSNASSSAPRACNLPGVNESSSSGKSNQSNSSVKSLANASPSAPRASLLQPNSPAGSLANKPSPSGKSNPCSTVKSRANASLKSNLPHHNSPVNVQINSSSVKSNSSSQRIAPQAATPKKSRSIYTFLFGCW